MISVLFDGWPLSYHPNSPGALHTLTLLEACTQEIEPVVLLPAPPPEWFPVELNTHQQPTPNTSAARLNWEQRILPGLARRFGVQVVHLTSLTPALIAPVPTVISPAGFGAYKSGEVETFGLADRADRFEPGQSMGFIDRIRQSLARGAMDRIAVILWPADIPYPPHQQTPNYLKIIPPAVHPAFLMHQTGSVNNKLNDLPEAYFLYHGPCNHHVIQTLLRAWAWASGPIGEVCSLVIIGMDETGQQQVNNLLPEYDLEETVRMLPALSPQELARLYQGSSGLFHPAQICLWEGPVRQALASGRPVVAAKTNLAEALVGPAAYLIDEQNTRAMGAALITIVVEENVAESLSQAARERTLNWDPALFQEQLMLIYRTLGNNW
jgi:glycosyltransferase involved in cell wall biosynthesis